MIGKKMELLRDALCAAFDQNSFDEMLRFRLDKVRSQVAGPGAFSSVVFRVIDTAVREGWLPELITAAWRYNPRNPALRQFCTDHPELAFAEELVQVQPRAVVGWGQFIDPDDDCAWRLKNNTLTILVPGREHDLGAERGVMNAPRIMQQIVGDFA